MNDAKRCVVTTRKLALPDLCAFALRVSQVAISMGSTVLDYFSAATFLLPAKHSKYVPVKVYP